MKVRELVELLKGQDQDAEVYFHVDEFMADTRDAGGDYYVNAVKRIDGESYEGVRLGTD